MKKLGTILIILIILVFNFIIGANEKGLRVLEISALMSLILVYLVALKIKSPKKSILFKNKIDYFVLGFMITTTLPLIFSTYCSFSDTIEFILKYFFIYSVYLLVRNTIVDKKQIECIITATLFCALIPIILGIDNVNGKYLDPIVNFFDVSYISDNMFSATFGYANAVAIYMGFCMFLAIHKVNVSEKIGWKIFFVIYAVFAYLVMWRTKSRSLIALISLILVIYLIIINRKLIIKYWKQIVISAFIGIVVIVPILIYALGVSEPFILTDKIYTHRMKYQFEPNKTYTLELEVQANEKREALINFAYEVEVIQANKYFKESKIASKRFGTVDGIIKLEFTPTDDYSYINVVVLNDFNGKLNIKKCFINGHEYIMNYKYVPNFFGKIFSEYSFNEKSLKERGFIYSSCLTLAGQSPIIGQGGNTWHVLSETVQEYTGLLKETHSYFFELLISYGIIGVVAFLTMIIMIFVKLIMQFVRDKESLKYKLLIAIAVFTLLFHSITFDFNMSFMLIQLIVYIYLAILLYDMPKNCEENQYIDYVIFVFLIFIVITYIKDDIAKYMLDDYKSKHSIVAYQKTYNYMYIKHNESDDIEFINEIYSFMNREPYFYQNNVYNIYFRQIFKCLDKLSDDELENYINIGIDKFKYVQMDKPLYPSSIIERTTILVDLIKVLEGYDTVEGKRKEIFDYAIQELKTIITDEFEKNKDIIGARDKSGNDFISTYFATSEYYKLVSSVVTI